MISSSKMKIVFVLLSKRMKGIETPRTTKDLLNHKV